MIMRPPISTRTYKLFPYTTLLRSDTPVPDVGRGYAPDTRATSVARVTFRQTPRHLRSGLRPRRPASSPYPGFRFRPAPPLVVGRAYARDAPRRASIARLGLDAARALSSVRPTPPTPRVTVASGHRVLYRHDTGHCPTITANLRVVSKVSFDLRIN